MPFLIFLIVPLIEIALFITIGGAIGLWPTLALILVTALIGVSMIKAEGLRVLHEITTEIDAMRNPMNPIAHGALILLSGAFLLTPGFFTDALGFALLIPGLRRILIAKGAAHMAHHSFGGMSAAQRHSRNSRHSADIIEGEFEIADEERTLPR